MNIPRFIVLLAVFLCSMAADSLAKEIVFEGQPVSVKQQTSDNRWREGGLTPDEQVKAKIVISREGEKYFWDSNDRREMLFAEKENAYYFIDAGGKGLIKIVHDEETGKYYYMADEPSSEATYYGIAVTFKK